MDISKAKADILKEILTLAADELNKNKSVGYTMPDGKHHIYIYIDDSIKYADGSKTPEDGYYVIEPNRVVDGAHEPMGDTVSADYNDFGELMVACMRCMEQFEADYQFSNERLGTLLHNAIICLEEQGFDREQIEKDLGITSEEYSFVMTDELSPDKNVKSLYAPWKEFVLSRKECDEFVDRMVSTIRGIGIDAGSGYYGLKCFCVDDEQFNLYCEISKAQDDGNAYYAIYYAVEYDEGDTIFSDWRHTEIMDVEELKNVVFEIASNDYVKDVQCHIEKESNNKSSLSEKIEQASFRTEEANIKNQSINLSR